MTAKDVYTNAIGLLGYTDNAEYQRRALFAINKVYLELFSLIGSEGEFEPLRSLNEKINLPKNIVFSAMPSGVAELIALGEGDGELQQYFALDYDKAKAKINVVEYVVNKIP